MEYTVKEVSAMTGVTIKALHYYHKIGLLLPCRVTEAGYRLYGKKELERLQQILFYRELEFSLREIQTALQSESDRITCLKRQQKLLYAQRQRTDSLLDTIRKSIRSALKGETMSEQDLFQGFDQQGWEKALKPQSDYLKENYQIDLKTAEINPGELNEKAAEAKRFMDAMSEALRNQISAADERVQNLVRDHLKFLNDHGTKMDAGQFYHTSQFLSQDQFHRKMMEDQQIGLSYFLLAAAAQHVGNLKNTEE
ncbi:MerR family transcriptional regulator [Caproiciproducens faecalis]|uniref:MerR family transcriptional regulator n=1 Tax=Caproiciproducens faecalis TaxID=2820301 RepID=A0ABS7DLJ7_9FIRM|nr:MerR family transcriptional regulator [Caproiciproducens faecalis]MBW7572163.1 MerR family transcriptional regulator [Caproiciproducens faecalis]